MAESSMLHDISCLSLVQRLCGVIVAICGLIIAAERNPVGFVLMIVGLIMLIVSFLGKREMDFHSQD